jgi:prepilin-type N-terminal cleavage/methylation domain-containing protein
MIAARVRELRESHKRGDAGFTLVEMLISMLLFAILIAIVGTAVVAASKASTSNRQYNDINAEARTALNRMTRELRQAQAIVAVTNPYGSAATSYNATQPTSVTFDVDFNCDGVIEPDSADPEELTYTYSPSAQRLTLTAAGQSTPVLAANVTGFKLSFFSRVYRLGAYGLDTNNDGVISWEELDADPSGKYGNGNHVLDPLELGYIDSVTIELTVLKGTHQQYYQTQVDLRNRPY